MFLCSLRKWTYIFDQTVLPKEIRNKKTPIKTRDKNNSKRHLTSKNDESLSSSCGPSDDSIRVARYEPINSIQRFRLVDHE
ncbi:hypothetical protein QQP08_013663 [Theobroma cacao]|nr:hypothetical protein QQP08_013663 [Theobroma cacao]